MCIFCTIRAFKAHRSQSCPDSPDISTSILQEIQSWALLCGVCAIKTQLGMALWFREVFCRYISLIALLRTFILEENSSLFKRNKEGALCVKLSLYSLLGHLSFLLSSEVCLKKIKFHIWTTWVYYRLNWEVPLFEEVFSFIHILQLRAISIMS